MTGYSGGGVRFKWRYNREYTDNEKYFCRGQRQSAQTKSRIKTNGLTLKDSLL